MSLLRVACDEKYGKRVSTWDPQGVNEVLARIKKLEESQNASLDSTLREIRLLVKAKILERWLKSQTTPRQAFTRRFLEPRERNPEYRMINLKGT